VIQQESLERRRLAGIPALVLTAGVGQRLRPLSCLRAKAAVPVAGEPLIRRILGWLSRSGVRDVILNLHHRPETITRVVGDGADLGLRVRYSWEQPLLGSAGGPRRALPLLGADRFLIVNGDTLTDVDLAALAAVHARTGARVTMALIDHPDPRRYGGVRATRDGVVLGFTRRGDPTPAGHFVGVQVVNADVFADLPDGQPAESVNGRYRTLIADEPGAIRAVLSGAAFQDVGTPADYLATSLRVARDEGHPDLVPAATAHVDPSARLVRTAVWDHAVVGAGAALIECVVGDGARVPPGARFERMVLVPAGGRPPGPGERLVGDLLVGPI
jgi:mannose-1-phosphate guanylyltransferase